MLDKIYLIEKILLLVLIVCFISFKVVVNIYSGRKNIKDKVVQIKKNVSSQKNILSLKRILLILMMVSLCWIAILLVGPVGLKLGYYISLMVILLLWILFFVYSIYKEGLILSRLK